MIDPRSYPQSNGETGTPRWVKMFGIIAVVLVLLVIILMFIDGAEHGPGRHTRSIKHSVQQP
jgi:hypothetical protein